MYNLSYATCVEYHSTIDTSEKSSAALFSVEDYSPTISNDFHSTEEVAMGSHIRDRIKAARQHAMLTQEKLGELIGVSKSAVSMWETKNELKYTKPTLDNLKLISVYTGAPIDWLLDDKSEISTDWKKPADVIEFPNAASVDHKRLGDVANEAAIIIDSLPISEQTEIIHYLRIRKQTTEH